MTRLTRRYRPRHPAPELGRRESARATLLAGTGDIDQVVRLGIWRLGGASARHQALLVKGVIASAVHRDKARSRRRQIRRARPTGGAASTSDHQQLLRAGEARDDRARCHSRLFVARRTGAPSELHSRMVCTVGVLDARHDPPRWSTASRQGDSAGVTFSSHRLPAAPCSYCPNNSTQLGDRLVRSTVR